MKVAELNSAQLDRWAAKAEGIEVKYSTTAESWRIIGEPDEIQWMPHRDWAQAGPIIEREGIGFFRAPNTDPEYGHEIWVASDIHDACPQRGETPLIAALRCYVCSKFGEKVPEQ